MALSVSDNIWIQVERLTKVFHFRPRESTLRATLNKPHPQTRKWHQAPFRTTEKIPLIVFGSGMFGASGHASRKRKKAAVVNKLWRMLKRRERRGELVAVTIDEFYTSQVSLFYFVFAFISDMSRFAMPA